MFAPNNNHRWYILVENTYFFNNRYVPTVSRLLEKGCFFAGSNKNRYGFLDYTDQETLPIRFVYILGLGLNPPIVLLNILKYSVMIR